MLNQSQFLKSYFILGLYFFTSCKGTESQDQHFKLQPVKLNEIEFTIPDEMTNDWTWLTGFDTDNGRRLAIFDSYSKYVHIYNVEDKKLEKSLASFQTDTLQVAFITSLAFSPSGIIARSDKHFLILNEETGDVIRKWDHTFPMRNRIEGLSYGKQYLWVNGNFNLNPLDDWRIPVMLKNINKEEEQVFEPTYYEAPIMGTLDLNEGALRPLPIRFPGNFLKNGLSYPAMHLPMFTSFGPKHVAYSFKIDDKIHVFDLDTERVEAHSIVNPDFEINIFPISKEVFSYQEEYTNYKTSLSRYTSLQYDPINKLFLRTYIGYNKTKNKRGTYIEIIDENFNLLTYFPIEREYLGLFTPLFFDGEIWFVYWQGYQPDTMKFKVLYLNQAS